MKHALVLGGGGVKGAFQAGVLSVILADEEYVPSGIFGSSTGALNGAFLADRAGRQVLKSDVNWPSIGDDLVRFWRDTVTGPDALWTEPKDGWEAAEALARLAAGKGFLKTDPLKNIILREADPTNLQKALLFGIQYSPSAVDLITGNIEYPDVHDPNIISFILASAAIPIIMPYVEIENRGSMGRFVDGGMRDVAPFQRALELGYQKITCIVCQAENLKPVKMEDNIVPFCLRLYEVVFDEIVSNDLKVIEKQKALSNELMSVKKFPQPQEDQSLRKIEKYRDVTVEIIRPDEPIEVKDLNFSSDQIEYLIELGIRTAKAGKFTWA
jgi:NTE family protein